MRVLPFLLVLFAPVIVSGRPQTTERLTDGRTVPFLDHRPGAIAVPVSIDDAGPYRFLVDTGSTHTAIRDTFATSIGAVPVARTTLSTSAGRADALVVRLPHVAIGSAGVDELLATSLTAAAAGVLDDGIAGVIGQDFLTQFDYTLDYRRAALIWEREQNWYERAGIMATSAYLEAERGSIETALRHYKAALAMCARIPEMEARDLLAQSIIADMEQYSGKMSGSHEVSGQENDPV